MTIPEHCERVGAAIEALEWARRQTEWDPSYSGGPIPENLREAVTVEPRRKFIAIDIGTSGAWMVEIGTGEIFNIKGYGTPDKNKKAKADIGNIATVDPARMLSLRHNYLR